LLVPFGRDVGWVFRFALTLPQEKQRTGMIILAGVATGECRWSCEFLVLLVAVRSSRRQFDLKTEPQVSRLKPGHVRER
jgi:hypothetical protein